MRDYTKYQLKAEKEIRDILEGVSQISVFICEKCYKEFKDDSEPEYAELKGVLEKAGIKINRHVSIPFLCNNFLTEKKVQALHEDENIGIVSCGIGIQFVSAILKGRRVFALADSILQSGSSESLSGYHGAALSAEKCAGCGQCYLGRTAGICPVVACAKGLLNGPCGGASRDGKCEVNKELPCAWVEIYKRLKNQNRFFGKTVEARNFNILELGEKKKLSLISQRQRYEGFYGGVHPEEKKNLTENMPVKKLASPGRIFLFLSQHTGIPSEPVVVKGDKVKVGQKVAKRAGFISSALHSGVSGSVLSIEEKMHPSLQKKMPAIVIENDGLYLFDETNMPLKNWEVLENKKIIEFLQEKGIVGMGGAMFPTAVKLCPPKPVDTLIVNGCECEPYLNADNRLMAEHSNELFCGIKIAEKLLCAKKTFLAVEENKKEAIIQASAEKELLPGISLSVLKTKYPQGAERMLIKKVLNRTVPEGCLPFDAGAVVMNAGTVYALYKAVYEGKPLYERIVTVAGGNGVANPGNYLMTVGTPFSHIAEKCFLKGSSLDCYDFKMGGPMMGVLQKDMNSAVVKGTTGLLLLSRDFVEPSRDSECIKCGRCVDVCPMELYPHYYAFYGRKGEWEKFAEYGVKNCIECGCCQYICSSKIDLLGFIKEAKRYADNKT